MCSRYAETTIREEEQIRGTRRRKWQRNCKLSASEDNSEPELQSQSNASQGEPMKQPTETLEKVAAKIGKHNATNRKKKQRKYEKVKEERKLKRIL